MTDRPTILIVDDHALLADALVTALCTRGLDDVDVVAVDPIDDETVLAKARALSPRIVLLDVHLGPGRTAISLVQPLIALGARVLVMTASNDSILVASFLEAGAVGVLDKAQPFGEMVEMIRAALVDDRVMPMGEREERLADLAHHRRREALRLAPFERLTPREAHILGELVDGRTAEEIAKRYDVAVSTVRSHIRSVLRKLGVRNQLAAVALAREASWSVTAE